MKKFLPVSLMMFVTLTFLLGSCGAIGDLMKGSFWAGAIFVIIIIALIILVIARMGKKG